MCNHMKPIYDIFDHICEEMNERMFKPNGLDVGRVGFLIHRQKGANGYCYVEENWKIDGEGVREIALTDSAILGGTYQMMTTLAHELIHAVNAFQNVKDCSGKYHNKKFSVVCDKIGLRFETASKIGIRTPKQEHPVFIDIYNSLTDSEREILNNLSVLLGLGTQSKPKNKNLLVHICPMCGAKARASATTKLLCGECSNEDDLVAMEVSEGD